MQHCWTFKMCCLIQGGCLAWNLRAAQQLLLRCWIQTPLPSLSVCEWTRGLGGKDKFIPQKSQGGLPRASFLMWKDLSTTDVWAAWKMSPDFQGNWHVLLRNVLLEHPVLIQGTNPAFLDKASDHRSRMHLINSQCNWPSRSLWIISLISSCAGKVFEIHHLTSLKSLTPNPLKINRNLGGFSEFSLRSPQMWTGNKTSEWK